MSPPITGSSQSRTNEKIEERRPAKLQLNLNRNEQEELTQSKASHSWEPPIAWASTVEQDLESLPKGDSQNSQEIEEEPREKVRVHSMS
jgi:hypothetical protein